ncbi:Sec-independent protein translocase subunit TatA [Acinetobacter sp. ANC 5380]|uniref:Sec-independent protein translocase protein TatA n=1 Tax=Acinetobacter terrae TaxID=2731247 RepID=A0A7Y2RCW5_9GAMM|nr:Sec-independent protein translocase subunit TatA [Acinetobacter terrae]NNH76468.1 Sec-independent protein translocase subunit TatA [Acinetobacter terrae]
MGLSIWHIVLFAVVVILLFGTSKLKNLGKDLGGAIKDFKDSVKDENQTKSLEHHSNDQAKVIENVSEKTLN